MANLAKFLTVAIVVGLMGFWQARMATAQEPQSIEVPELNPLLKSEFLKDPYGLFTAETALEQDFDPLNQSFADFGLSRDVIWLKFVVTNPTDVTITRKLSFNVPYCESLTAYLVTDNQPPIQLLHADHTTTYSQRGEQFRMFATDLTLPANSQARVLVRYWSAQSTQMHISIEDPSGFYARIWWANLVNWTITGMLAGVVAITVLFLASVGFRSTIWYAGYMFGATLFLAQLDGYNFILFWPNAPEWNFLAIIPILFIVVGTGVGFARAFVEAPEKHPVLNVILLAAMFGCALFLLASLWFLYDLWYKITALSFVAVCALFCLVTGFVAVRHKHPGAGFYMLGVTCVSISFVFGVSSYLIPGMVDLELPRRVGQIAILIQAMLFSSAIFRHHQVIRDERDMALAAEVELTKDRLELSEALYSAELEQQEAVKLAEARRAQLASTAHDIRQPLASLRLALLEMNQADPNASHQIGQNFDYLETLVRQNLDATRPDDEWKRGAEAETGPTERFPASIVLDNVAAMFGKEAAAKGIDLRYVPSSALFDTDPVALTRVVMNLVANAVKHTSGGRILLGVRRLRDAHRIEIHDTGAGMTEDEISEALTPYSLGAGSEGTGLGLPVVAELVATLGGTFALHSRKGHGSIASVTIPVVPDGQF